MATNKTTLTEALALTFGGKKIKIVPREGYRIEMKRAPLTLQEATAMVDAALMVAGYKHQIGFTKQVHGNTPIFYVQGEEQVAGIKFCGTAQKPELAVFVA